MLERWNEYIGELFHDNRGEKPTITKRVDGPKMLKEEVREALERMNEKEQGCRTG